MSGGGLLAGFWSASLFATVIILAALLLRALFRRRIPQRVFCLLWDVALVRLLIPGALTSPVSVWRWLPKPSPARMPDMRPTVMPGLTAPVGGTAIEDTAVLSSTAALPSPSLDAGAVLTVVWMTVALALAAWFLWIHLRSRRLYADSLPCTDAFVRDWLTARSLCRRIQVRISDRIAAPLTYRILRPVVLLPAGMDWPDKAALSFVLEHEIQHIRCFDTLRKGLLAAVLCLHWFNPLVWVLYVLCNRDMELACDEAVVERGADRAGYARTLLDMEERRGRWGLSGSHFSQNALEERIKSIMKHKHISIAALIAVLTAMSVTVVAFASAAPNSEAGTLPGRKASASGYNIYDHFQDAECDVIILSRGGEDGGKLYSVDGGKTWLSEERYRDEYGSWGDDWWTAEDYLVWLEEEKAALWEELKAVGIGGDAYQMTYKGQLIRCLVDGASVWDNGYSIRYVYINPDGEVDIHTLRSVIRNADGSYDPIGELVGMAAEGEEGFDRNLIDSAIFSAGSVQAATQTREDIEKEIGAGLEPYKAFGLSYRCEWNQDEEVQLRMSWNGRPVHSLWDTETGVWFANNLNGTELGEDAVDLETIYQGGRLCGLREGSPHDGAASGQGVQTAYAEGDGGEGGISFEEVFARYQPYGLVYTPRESGMGSLAWNGRTVKSFADLRPDGGAFSYQDPYVESGLRVYAEYDAGGNLTGLCAE